VGAQVWGDTTVMLGSAVNGALQQVLARQSAHIEGEAEQRSLRVAEILATFPVSVLRSARE